MTTGCINEEAVTPEALGALQGISTSGSGTKRSAARPWEREALPLRILLADDHPIIRQHVRAILEEEGFEVAGEAADGREAVRLAQRCSPDLVILDVSMPALNGLAAAGEILRDIPETRAILLTLHTEPPYVRRAIRAGIRGYVEKSQMATDLPRAIRDVAHGKLYISPTISGTAGPVG
jgi:two-component system, NarL family, response regulator DegU